MRADSERDDFDPAHLDDLALDVLALACRKNMRLAAFVALSLLYAMLRVGR